MEEVDCEELEERVLDHAEVVVVDLMAGSSPLHNDPIPWAVAPPCLSPVQGWFLA